MIRETNLAAERLRESGVQPIGLVPGSDHPPAGHIAEQTSGPAADLRPGGVITSVRLRYGDAADQSATVVDITSDFTPDFKSFCPLEYELVRAQNEYQAIARGELDISDPPDEPEGPFTRGSAEILLNGAQQTIATLTYADYHALRFEFNGVHVTVVSRYEMPGPLSFEPITDLTPYLPGALDREDLRRHLRSRPGQIFE